MAENCRDLLEFEKTLAKTSGPDEKQGTRFMVTGCMPEMAQLGPYPVGSSCDSEQPLVSLVHRCYRKMDVLV